MPPQSRSRVVAGWASRSVRGLLPAVIPMFLAAALVVPARADDANSPPVAPQSSPAPFKADLNVKQANETNDDFISRSSSNESMLAGPMSSPAPITPVVTRQVGPGGIIPVPIAVHLRLGAAVSPRTKFVAGADVTLPGVVLFPGLTTRIDAEAIFSANFGGVTTIVPLTFNQVYGKTLAGGVNLYGGIGVGPYFGERTRFGGKVFVGGGIGRFAGELGVNFTGAGDPVVTLEVRLPLY